MDGSGCFALHRFCSILLFARDGTVTGFGRFEEERRRGGGVGMSLLHGRWPGWERERNRRDAYSGTSAEGDSVIPLLALIPCGFDDAAMTMMVAT